MLIVQPQAPTIHPLGVLCLHCKIAAVYDVCSSQQQH